MHRNTFFPRAAQRGQAVQIDQHMLSTFCFPMSKLLFNEDLQHASGTAGSAANRNGDEDIMQNRMARRSYV